ncbi:MAG: hypothetical protein WAO15_06955 [Mycobacterium sp.]
MTGQRPEGELGDVALVSIGIGGMVGGGIFSVLGLTVQIASAGAYLSFVAGGVIAALTGRSYALRYRRGDLHRALISAALPP